MLVHFPTKKTYSQRLDEVFQTYRNAKRSVLELHFSDDGSFTSRVDGINELVLRPSLNNFSILPQMLGYYRRVLGGESINRVVETLKSKHCFSASIFEKAKSAIFNDEISFKREAQFPPIIIRRPEKNLYYATTFNMALVRFFVLANEEIIAKGGAGAPRIVVENMEACDRCSLRLLQNLFLYIKSDPINFTYCFKSKSESGDGSDFLSQYYERYVAAREHCFRKVFNVAQAVGSLPSDIDTDGVLRRIDFGYVFNQEVGSPDLWSDELSPVDDAMDMVYKSNYEKFYCMISSATSNDNTNMSELDRLTFNKLCILSDSFNYNFDAALQCIDGSIDECGATAFAYKKLFSGLIKLKKFKQLNIAEDEFNSGLDALANEPSSLERSVEEAFLRNAKNLIGLLGALEDKDESVRSEKIYQIIDSEHELLDGLLELFISVPDRELNKGHNLLNLMFVITTLIENISKLNMLVGDSEATIALYENYEHILSTMADRMQQEAFSRSYTISYSHALLHIKVAIANQKVRQKKFVEAYDITSQLLRECETYDVTGDYKGYILNAHSIYCLHIGKIEEAFTSLVEMLEIYMMYNEPYMIKAALNGLSSRLEEFHPAAFSYLRKLSVVDSSFKRHDEIAFLVSSPVDLENSLNAGLDKHLSGRSIEKSFSSQRASAPNDLQSAYRAYGLWRQIYTGADMASAR